MLAHNRCMSSSEEDPELLGTLPLPRPGLTAQEVNRELAGWLPAVPATQPPPADMPPLPLMVLDSLADAPESVYTMRNCGEMAPYGLALVGEAHLLDAVRSLLSNRLIEVESEYVIVGDRLSARRLPGDPGTTDGDLQRYWFRMTAAGETTWEAAGEVLTRYADSHPLTPRVIRRDDRQE